MTDCRGWSKTTLGEIVGVTRGRSDPQSMPELPFIGMENVEPHSMKILGTVPAAMMRSSAAHFFAGDVLYGRLRPYLNKVVCPGFEGLASAEFIPLTAHPGIDADFVRFRLNAADFVAFASHLDEGDRPRVDWDGISPFEVQLPPGLEQRRIVEALDDYLSRLDAATGNLERAQAKLKAYRASVLKAAIEGRLVPTEADLARREKRDFEPAQVLLERILRERRRRWEEAELTKLKASGRTPRDDRWKAKYQEPEAPETSSLPELPEGWCWASVDQVGDVLLGRQRSPAYLTGRWTRPYLRVANIKDDRIDYGDVEEMDFDEVHFEKYALSPGDILVSEGQSPHLVGQSAIYRGGIDGLCFQKTLHRFRAVDGGPSAEFVQIVLRAHVKTGVFKALAPITTNIAHLTLENFKASRFPLPPVAEQERIAGEVGRLLSTAEVADERAAVVRGRLGRLRQAILKWAFEGKLVDQDPADEPAEKLLERIRARNVATTPGKKTRGRKARAA